jgi:hypothetical protein
MKFGVTLLTHRIPGWRYIDYEALKLAIQSAHARLRVTGAVAEERARFFDILSFEIDAVESDFIARERELVGDQCEQCGRAAAALLLDLVTHMVVNYLACLKIVKKFDKNFPGAVLSHKLRYYLASQRFVRALCEPEFFRLTGDVVSMSTPLSPQQCADDNNGIVNSKNVDGNADMRSLPGKRALTCPTSNQLITTAASSSSSALSPDTHSHPTCPICLEVSLLNCSLQCGHRFCVNCLLSAVAVNHHNCPLCRCEEPLNPINVHVQHVLGNFSQSANRYFPQNVFKFHDSRKIATLSLLTLNVFAGGWLSNLIFPHENL